MQGIEMEIEYKLMEGEEERTDKKRTPMMNCLIPAFIFCVVLTLGLLVGFAYYVNSYYTTKDQSTTNQLDVCSTAECIKTASNLLDFVDTSVDPCQDFYSFSCGKWIKNTVRLDGNVNHFTEVTEYFLKRVKEMLEQENDIHAEHFIKAKTFYSTCMNRTTRENISMVLNDLKAIGDWPMVDQQWSDDDWMTITHKLLVRGYNTNLLISFFIARDDFNNTIKRLQFQKPTLGLQLKAYDDNKTMSLYRAFILSLTKEFSSRSSDFRFNANKTSMDIKNAVDIEITLAKINHTSLHVGNPYQRIKFSELQTKAPELDWNRYIRLHLNETIPPEEVVIVLDIAVIQKIVKYLSELNSTYEGRRSLDNYLMYRTALYVMGELGRTHEDGDAETWKKCVSSTVQHFEISMLAVYQKKYFNEEKRTGTVAIVHELKQQLINVLTETEWMDRETKDAAINKVKAITVMAGFPDDFRNDTKVNEWYKEFEVGSNYLRNAMNGNLYLLKKVLSSFRLPADANNWLYLPPGITDTNAFYAPQENEIFISIGISSDFYFNEKNPSYINYGRMGMVLGHELTHSIDQRNANYDSKGNIRNWWTNATLTRYYKETVCIVKQFSDYVDNTTGLSIRGLMTFLETTADSGGVQMAYNAYLKYAETHKLLSLPALPYSPNQLFWISYATLWCGKSSKEYLENLIRFDPHPPSNFRVLGALSNSPEFATDFSCKRGSPMNPLKKKCTIFGRKPKEPDFLIF